MNYYPFEVRVKDSAAVHSQVSTVLPWQSQRAPPQRRTNRNPYETNHLECDFNFKNPNQIDSLMNVMLLFVIMVLMVGFSLVLSNSVSAIVLRPLEKLLFQVRKMASTIFQSVTDMAVTMKEEQGEAADDADDEEEEEA